MDALAKIKGVNLKVYVKDKADTGKLVLVHAFKGGDEPINVAHVAADPSRPGVLNHFNRLEETEDFTRATHRVEEHMQEEYGDVVTEEGYDRSLPFTTVATFVGNVYDFCHYVMEQNATFNPNSTVEETLTAPGVDVSSNPQTMESIKNSVVDALRENGATDSDIQTILSDPGMASLIQAGAKFDTLDKDFRTIDILTRNPDGTFSGPSSTGPSRFGKVLESGLSVMCSAAATLSDFNDAHPTLTNLAILSVQTALSGPTQFVKSYALERSGIQGAIDQQVDAGTAWINDKLVNQLSMDAFYADILTEGGKFGFVIGAGMLGAGSKDKIVDSAKGAAEKLKMLKNPGRAGKQINGNSRSYVGETHVYAIRDEGGNIHKIGESMKGVNKLGQSKRAELQRRKLERTTGQKHETEIRDVFPNKDAARTRETGTIKKYREYFGDDKLPGNKGNR
jgi:hypothetical protein